MLAIVVGAGTAVFVALLGQRTAQLRREQSAQARDLGLRVTDLGRWVGRRDGVYLVVQVDIEPFDPWSVHAKLPFATPRGFHLGPHARGRDLRVLRDAVEPMVEAIEARGLRVELGPAVILRRPRQHPPFTVSQRRAELAYAIDSVVLLVRQLQRRYRELVDAGMPRSERLARPWSGTVRPRERQALIRRVPLAITGPYLDDDRWMLEVRAPIVPPLPAGTRVTSRPQGRHRRREPRASGIGDLVLDQALQALSEDPGALGRRLARDAVRGPVLDVLAAHPRSELLADEVVHVVEDGALEVEAAVGRVVELVNALALTVPAPDHASA